jgi:hypothetical protein
MWNRFRIVTCVPRTEPSNCRTDKNTQITHNTGRLRAHFQYLRIISFFITALCSIIFRTMKPLICWTEVLKPFLTINSLNVSHIHPLTRLITIRNIDTIKKSNNKKVWEELIAYVLSYDTDHIENDVSNNCSIVACVFVAALMFLQSRCLATTGETHTDTQTDGKNLWSTPLSWAQVPWCTF